MKVERVALCGVINHKTHTGSDFQLFFSGVTKAKDEERKKSGKGRKGRAERDEVEVPRKKNEWRNRRIKRKKNEIFELKKSSVCVSWFSISVNNSESKMQVTKECENGKVWRDRRRIGWEKWERESGSCKCLKAKPLVYSNRIKKTLSSRLLCVDCDSFREKTVKEKWKEKRKGLNSACLVFTIFAPY